jgi:hypothetical protein
MVGRGKYPPQKAHRAQVDGSLSPIMNSALPKSPPILPRAGYCRLQDSRSSPGRAEKAALSALPRIGTVRDRRTEAKNRTPSRKIAADALDLDGLPLVKLCLC